MQFVTVRELRLKPGQVWKKVQQGKDVIITSNGKPMAILTGVTEDTLEDELDSIRTARALKALDSIQESSVSQKTDRLSLKEIEKEIKAVRKVRKR